MRQKDYYKLLKEMHKKEEEITYKKNGDYSPQSDALSNFRKYGEVQLLSRMYEKFLRLENIINTGKINVSEESFSDTICDLSNYCHLLAAYVKDTKLVTSKNKSKIKNDPLVKKRTPKRVRGVKNQPRN